MFIKLEEALGNVFDEVFKYDSLKGLMDSRPSKDEADAVADVWTLCAELAELLKDMNRKDGDEGIID